jgi:hypothetical protein
LFITANNLHDNEEYSIISRYQNSISNEIRSMIANGYPFPSSYEVVLFAQKWKKSQRESQSKTILCKYYIVDKELRSICWLYNFKRNRDIMWEKVPSHLSDNDIGQLTVSVLFRDRTHP